MVHQCSSLLHSFCFTLFIFISISSWHPLFRLSVSINGRFQCRGGPLLLDQFVQSTDTAANVLLYHPLVDSEGVQYSVGDKKRDASRSHLEKWRAHAETVFYYRPIR